MGGAAAAARPAGSRQPSHVHMDDYLFFLAAICVVIAIRVYAGSKDAGRVRAYVEERGGQLLSSTWTPFGKGWFGDKSDRIYEVRYLDQEGNEHLASCKTSMFSGVYFTEDNIVAHGAVPARRQDRTTTRLAELERENQWLREELERARRRGR